MERDVIIVGPEEKRRKRKGGKGEKSRSGKL